MFWHFSNCLRVYFLTLKYSLIYGWTDTNFNTSTFNRKSLISAILCEFLLEVLVINMNSTFNLCSFCNSHNKYKQNIKCYIEYIVKQFSIASLFLLFFDNLISCFRIWRYTELYELFSLLNKLFFKIKFEHPFVIKSILILQSIKEWLCRVVNVACWRRKSPKQYNLQRDTIRNFKRRQGMK